MGHGSKRVRALGTLSAFLFALLVSGCAAFGPPMDPPTLTLLDLKPIPGGAFEQRLELELLVQNPNDFDLAIDGLRLQLDLNGQRLGRAVSKASLAIPRLDEARVKVEASITLFDVARQLLALEGKQSLDYRLAGDVFVVQPRARRLSFDSSGEVLPSPSK